ncbi:peptidoglycan-binding protein [Myxococcus llanfairpwllgwyngyllgogerychwyrndrobwllllantysiliogogogochensis]|uniref:Peptidoglycan-binding protein n=1 Tax=Myxococcus llanfairpwllgwyngyllgogerychwyrndrobwllllantysiliogogogochensis TaxID=2590453 RepID=A0A540X0L7_9BACT|nr:peptidoglycan-binding protein [Myxococcus llanfairpwllgwyngyllgogerychwyrndrobwllllantysiliogogogochensis]TQF14743.1 peptidoglycan-binding protein [Myxococcus llanfairpwllgwyngyllgogerychwyrndrobwllllantysiliogogogochensis]
MSDDATPLAKAKLLQLDSNFEHPIDEQTTSTVVQFNPETLKVAYANQVQQPSGGGDQRGTPAQQFVGAGTTKLSVQLWFDVTGQPEGASDAVEDVRKLTAKVAFFITPKKEGDKFVPPAVRFLWGSFQFDGIMESMEESLELFSAEGLPLRASVSFSLSQQKITAFVFAPTQPPAGASPNPSGKGAGEAPMKSAPEGSTVQGLASNEGKGASWQGIASANGIENPRRLAPGQLIDLQAGVNIGVRR